MANLKGYTNGVKNYCEENKCFWFLDIVNSYQTNMFQGNQPFQVWQCKKTLDGGAVVTCEDGNDKVLIRQEVAVAIMNVPKAVIWVEGGVALLPSEH